MSKSVNDLFKELGNYLENPANFGDIEKLKEASEGIKKLLNKFLNSLDILNSYGVFARNEKDLETFRSIYTAFTKEYFDKLKSELEKLGEEADDSLADAIGKVYFKLLTLSRMGRKADVFEILLRIYRANDKEFPKELRWIFSSAYNSDEFRILLMSFLAGINDKLSKSGGKR